MRVGDKTTRERNLPIAALLLLLLVTALGFDIARWLRCVRRRQRVRWFSSAVGQ